MATKASTKKTSTTTSKPKQPAYKVPEGYTGLVKPISKATENAFNDIDASNAARMQALTDRYNSDKANDQYMAMYNQQSSMLNQQASLNKAYQQQLLNQSESSINSAYDQGANDTYINYRQGQRGLEEQLSNMGVTGGASESSNLRLQNAYAQNLSKNENNRRNDLTSAKNNYSSQVNSINNQLSSALSDAYSYYGGMSSQYQQDIYKAYQDQLALAELDANNRKIMAKENERAGQGWNTMNWYDELGGYHYVRDKGAEYLASQNKITQKAINTANALTQTQGQHLADLGYTVKYDKDKNGVLSAVVTGKKTVTNSSSKSSSSGKSSGSGTSSSSSVNSRSTGGNGRPNTKQVNAYKTMQTNIANALMKDSSKSARQRYVDLVKNQLDNNNITESQAYDLLKMLGY